MNIGISETIRAARYMKQNGCLATHKVLLRQARRALNFIRLTCGQPSRYVPRNTEGVVVMCRPRLPDRSAWYIGRNVVVCGESPRRTGKSWFADIRALAMSMSLDVIFVEEAESVPDGVWERLNRVGLVGNRTISIDSAGVSPWPQHGKSGGMSKGDKIRHRKMFGGY